MTNNSKKAGEEKRGTWGNRFEFFLATLGYCVGLGTLTRFPYVVMKNGGGAFLIPFILCMIIAGAPLFYLELILGQFSGKSPLTMWVICPALKGIGYSMTLLTFVASTYYMPFTWSMVYLVASFNSELPWATCNNEWNTANCGDLVFNETNATNMTTNLTKVSPAEEYWNEQVLGITKSEGIHDLGSIRWQLAVAHLSTWVIVFLCSMKGTASAGKVVYVTATLPYLLLTVLVVRGLTLEGSLEGVIFFLKPDFNKLLDYNVWIEAAIQTAFELGPGWGTLITMASYNKFDHKCYKDAIAVPLLTLFTAIYGGLAVFSVLGHLAFRYGVEVANVADSGPGLSYVAYPAAIATLPLPQLWSVIFFLTLITVAIDSQFASFETYVSGFLDYFPRFRRYKVLVAAVFASCCFCIGLPLCTDGGMYIYQILDWYAAALTFTVCAFLEVVIVANIYGLKRFFTDVILMFGSPPNYVVGGCWLIVSPALMATMTFLGLSNLEPPTYDYTNYHYPDWAVLIGWLVAALSFLPTPIVFIYMMIRTKGSPKKLKQCFQPTEYWLPNKESLVTSYRQRWYPNSIEDKYMQEPPPAYQTPDYFIEQFTAL